MKHNKRLDKQWSNRTQSFSYRKADLQRQSRYKKQEQTTQSI